MAERLDWEYQTFAVQGGQIVVALNALGRDGWEACATLNDPTHGLVFLCKRPASAIIAPTGEDVRALALVSP